MIFDLDDMNIEILEKHESEFGKSFEFLYNGKRYYYKNCKSGEFYNEIVAEKIAKKLNIPCCHYVLSFNNGLSGVSSEMFETTNYYCLKQILQEVYGKVSYLGLLDEKKTDGAYKSKNNLEDIWYALYKKYGSRKNGEEIVSRLMTQIVRIFLFDVVIGNSDRHTENLGFIDDGDNVEVAPIFDNDYMLIDYAVYDNDYSIFVEPEDFFAREDYTNFGIGSEPPNTLKKFFDVSASEYKDELNEMLEAISKESLEEIFTELENEGLTIDSLIKDKYINKFELNQRIIKNIISRKSSK